MDLETTYNERIKQIYEAVKRLLDYQISLKNIRKDFKKTKRYLTIIY